MDRDYTYTTFFTYGGAAGTYALQTPYDSDCEYTIISVAMLASGSVTLGPTAETAPNAGATLSTYGLAAAVFVANSTSNYTGHGTFAVCPRVLYLVSTAACYVTLQFRRRITQPIYEQFQREVNDG